jgi:flagella basal body P-ring formation protein FlgA
MEEVGLGSALSLQDRVIELIERFAGVGRSELKIFFSDHDQKTLAQSAYQDRYEFEPLASVPLGRVPIVIRRYRDNRLVETYRVTVDVAQRFMAVVAKNTIGRHQVFTPSDIEIREVYLSHAGDPVMDLARVIGQRSASVLRADAVVFDQHLQPSLMVRRGELITVRCISGGLVIRTIGRATEDGALDQVIQVRRDRSRRVYPVRITGRQEGMTLSSDLHGSLSMRAGAARSVDRSQP